MAQLAALSGGGRGTWSARRIKLPSALDDRSRGRRDDWRPVCALWIGFAWILFARSAAPEKAWVLLVGAAASVLFGAALIFILLSQRIDLRRFGVMESIATRWDRLIAGVASVLRGHATIVVLYSIGVWILEVLALASVVRSFDVSLSPPEGLMSVWPRSAHWCRPPPAISAPTNWCSHTYSKCSAISKRPESSRQLPSRSSVSARSRSWAALSCFRVAA